MAGLRVFSCILFFLLSDGLECGTVTTRSGEVRGGQRDFSGLHRNGSYHSFQGIPYAEPPVGPLRFRPPVAVTAWREELDASGEPGSQCIQPEYYDLGNFGKITGDEDCLTLNIYSETLPQKSRSLDLKPVFFWIHGGAFSIGAGSMFGQKPDLLLESGMVVVTINYRLGALGFMAIEGSDISGNQGLKDQLLALRWVKENMYRQLWWRPKQDHHCWRERGRAKCPRSHSLTSSQGRGSVPRRNFLQWDHAHGYG